MSDIFLTREETAQALRLSVRTVDSLIARGELAVRRVGRRVLVPPDELKRFAAVGEASLGQSLKRTKAHVANTESIPEMA